MHLCMCGNDDLLDDAMYPDISQSVGEYAELQPKHYWVLTESPFYRSQPQMLDLQAESLQRFSSDNDSIISAW